MIENHNYEVKSQNYDTKSQNYDKKIKIMTLRVNYGKNIYN